MGVDWNSFIPKFILGAEKAGASTTNTSETPSQKPTVSAQPSQPELTVDMSELEIKAAMNQALGFTKTSVADAIKVAKADAEFAQDPIAFAAKYASAEVRQNAQEFGVNADYALQAFRGETALSDMGPEKFLSENITPERRAEIEAGFAQKNPSPRAFTGEFLDIFAA